MEFLKKERLMTSKDRFLAVIKGKEVDRVPVFPLLMSFSAKRYGVSYRQFATNGKIMAESQLKIREMFKIDAITACSDAFRISADLGAEMVYPEEKPPYVVHPLITNERDLKQLKRPDVSNSKGRMADRIMGTRLMIENAGRECMVLGWVDMPFAEACSVCGISQFMMMLYDEPELAHAILDFLTPIVIDFAIAQIEVGAPMIGAGDAAASLISPELYKEFALPYEQKICEAVHKAGGMVKIHICGNTTKLLKDMTSSGADLFNVDHLVSFHDAKENFSGAGKAFKGNLNPVTDMLYSTPEECFVKAKNLVKQAAGVRYMLSPGCEVPSEVSEELFTAFCEAVL
jgi:MtaA/CmuA family methyltransferase